MNYGSYYYSTQLEASRHQVTQVTAPQVTLQELKDHLQIYEDDFDMQFQNVILPAATEIVNSIMGEYAGATNVAAYYSVFGARMRLPNRQVASIASVQYYNAAHTLATLPTTSYIFDVTTGNEIVVIGDFPVLSDRFRDPVVINYVVNVDTNQYNIELLIQATLLVAAELWYNKGDTVEGSRQRAAYTAERLLAPIKRVSI